MRENKEVFPPHAEERGSAGENRLKYKVLTIPGTICWALWGFFREVNFTCTEINENLCIQSVSHKKITLSLSSVQVRTV